MVTEIDRQELKQKMDHPKKFILLEALPPESYHRAHLPGAINLPPDRVRALATELMPRKDFEVIIYCAGPACHASEDVARELSEMGYANVRRYIPSKKVILGSAFLAVYNSEFHLPHQPRHFPRIL
jgi:rhodanese-related sulfurtransferase